MNSDALIHTAIWKAGDAVINPADDTLAVEEPLEIALEYTAGGNLQQKSISVTMRTPGNDEELACGFLFTEGIVTSATQIRSSRTDAGGNKIVIALQPGFTPLLSGLDRNFYTTSSCGVCGKSSIEAIRTVLPFPANESADTAVALETLYRLPGILRKRQELFDSTGGLHASALFDTGGNFIALREDVGRHNALDKLVGAAMAAHTLPLSGKVLLLSGRASFELLQKAAMAGISVVAAVGAPSSLAVSLAREQDITLAGFLRDSRCNIYTAPHRICAALATQTDDI